MAQTLTFLGVISLVAAAYLFWTRRLRMGIGFLLYFVAFVLLIPDLTVGIKANFVNAAAMVLFVAGTVIVVFKRSLKKEEETAEEAEQNPVPEKNN